MRDIKFSIAIPTFNRLHLLKITLNSVLQQTYHNFEVIISDNNSDDGTQEYITHVASIDSRVKVNFDKENVGMSRNWDTCLDLAIGDYFLLLSDDDYFANVNVLTSIASSISSIACLPKVIATDVNILKKETYVTTDFLPSREIKVKDFFYNYLTNKLRVYPCATFIKRDEIKSSYTSFNAKLACDGCMLVSVLNLTDEVYYIGERHVVYRSHDSLSSSTPNIWQDDLLILKEMMKRKYDIFILDKVIDEACKRSHIQYISRCIKYKKYREAIFHSIINSFDVFCLSNFKFLFDNFMRKRKLKRT
ncbi:TPA: glycosyltransferase family 2 protein [Vibrio cholerae]|nr:glycosyltransferase family 2 protein [Vibrio cholerae]